MILSYSLRLVFLCFAFFFLAHATLGLVAWATGPAAIRLAERIRPRTAARFLFALRLLPAALGMLVLFVLCVPSYLWLEPKASAERVGLLCITAAAAGAALWVTAAVRTLLAAIGSLRFKAQCDRSGEMLKSARKNDRITVIETDYPLIALAGLFRPQVFVSRSAMNALSAEELAAALEHERVHRASGDNWKRLLLRAAPEAVPFSRCFAKIEHAWLRLSECAADADATHGDEHASLALASALIEVARLGTARQVPAAVSSLVPDPRDLAERIDRLLAPPPPRSRHQARTIVAVATASLLVAGLVAAMFSPSALIAVHEILERLIA
ncbi:MAG TPA: M56 family metallopeptidase [Candidatus Acidoferrales bacterium]|nr:M56 family metallopeptidase [Candidatus Acidoferrales bacterium]